MTEKRHPALGLTRVCCRFPRRLLPSARRRTWRGGTRSSSPAACSTWSRRWWTRASRSARRPAAVGCWRRWAGGCAMTGGGVGWRRPPRSRCCRSTAPRVRPGGRTTDSSRLSTRSPRCAARPAAHLALAAGAETRIDRFPAVCREALYLTAGWHAHVARPGEHERAEEAQNPVTHNHHEDCTSSVWCQPRRLQCACRPPACCWEAPVPLRAVLVWLRAPGGALVAAASGAGASRLDSEGAASGGGLLTVQAVRLHSTHARAHA